ncbi:MAG: enolase C-terminal domain-like protein [Bryobacterales bacterium]
MDPNSAWTVETSIRAGEELKEELADGGYLEDPAAGHRRHGGGAQGIAGQGHRYAARFERRRHAFAHMPESIRQDAVQVVLCDHHFWGGMRQVQHLGKLCQTFGIALSMHSNSHLGVSLMAMAHVAAATPNLTYACDTHYPWQWSDEIVAGGRVKIVGGKVAIPNKGGLGVELDYDALARLKERYEKCAYRKRDDEAEMQKHVDPNWKRVLPRW